jgi:hypothetical protein
MPLKYPYCTPTVRYPRSAHAVLHGACRVGCQLKADVSVRQPTSDTPHAPASAPALAPAPTPAAPPAALDEDPPMGAPGLGSRHAHKTLKPVSLPADKPPPAAKPAVPVRTQLERAR